MTLGSLIRFRCTGNPLGDDRFEFRSTLALLGLSLALIGGCRESNSLPPPDKQAAKKTAVPQTEPARQSDPLDPIRRDLADGKLERASRGIRTRLISSPDDAEANLLAARIAASQGNLSEAVATVRAVLRQVETDSKAAAGDLNPADDAAIPDRSRCYQVIAEIVGSRVKSVSQADLNLVWTAIESELRQRPERHNLRGSLVDLLNRFGHRHRACQHCDWLCAAGQLTTRHLGSLIARRASFPLPDTTPESEAPGNASIAGSARSLADARREYTLHHYSNACDVLSERTRAERRHPEMVSLHGLVLAEAQRFDEFPIWLAGCSTGVTQYAEFWSAIGLWCLHRGEPSKAASAFLAAIEIDATRESDYRRLAQCLESLDRSSDSQMVIQRGRQVGLSQVQLAVASTQASPANALGALAANLKDLGRPYEFIAWQAAIGKQAGAPPSFLQSLDEKRVQLNRIADLARLSARHRRMGLTTDDFPTPDLQAMQQIAGATAKDPLERQPPPAPPSADSPQVHFETVTRDAGIDFQYANRTPIRTIAFRLHETLGGAIAVIDFDQDGWPDLYFGQGSGDPPTLPGDQSNVLLRHVGDRFVPVTTASQTTDHSYSTGIAVGDLNQDGFPDLYVGSLSRNRILINQGDGSFRPDSFTIPQADYFSASLAIADISGDHLPDLIETNYVGGDNLFDERPMSANGIPSGLSPLDYTPAPDRVLILSRNGTLTASALESDGIGPANSLGLIVADIDGVPGNEIFIANDANPNRFWKRINQTSPVERWVETAAVSGLALDYAQIPTAGMGIAAGDLDGNGRIDFHVTNFWQQFSSLFIQQQPGIFADLAPRYGLDTLTYATLGFGTQAFDADADGDLDLAIVNGHIEDFTAMGHAFKMPPQLLLNQAGDRNSNGSVGFVATGLNDSAGYGSTPRLGRALTLMDWNRDGRTDLIASHLDTPTELLENRTRSDGKAFRIRLVGTSSERDAIGAIVSVRTPKQETVLWAKAGDGYFCSNEGYLECCTTSIIESLTVRWPTGQKEQFDAIQTGSEYLIVEGTGQPYPLYRFDGIKE